MTPSPTGTTGTGTPAPTANAAAGGPAPSVTAANGDIGSQVAAYFKARGVAPNPTSVDYWSQKWQEFGAKDPAYFNQRLAIADEFGGAKTASAPAPQQQPYLSSLGGTLNMQPTPPGTLRLPTYGGY